MRGDADGRARLRDLYRDLVVARSLEIVTPADLDRRDLFEGVDGVMLHSLPHGFLEWFAEQRIVNRLPVVQHIHSLMLLDNELGLMAEFWRTWRGWPPARLVAPSVCTARRTVSLGPAVTDVGGSLASVDIIPHGG